jgi:hypothetical protein
MNWAINILKRLYYAHYMYNGFEYGGLILGKSVANCIAYGLRGKVRKAYDYPKKGNNLEEQKWIGYHLDFIQCCGLCSFTYLPLKHFKLIKDD